MSLDRIPLFIDSANRISGTPGNFAITLLSPIKRVSQIEVVSVEIPYTFYNINSSNNEITFHDVTDFFTARLNPGNYSLIDFITELENAMNAQMPGFSVSYNKNTYKLTIANISQFRITYMNTTLVNIIGLSEDSTYGTSFTLQNAINLSGPNYIMIKSESLTRPKIAKSFFNSNEDSVLYKVPISTNSGSIIIEKNIYNTKLKYGAPQTINMIDLKLVDPYNNPIDLNGQNWSITIIAEIM